MGSAPDAKTYNYLGTAYFLVPAEGENPNAGKDQAMLNSATLKIKDINGEGLKVENVLSAQDFFFTVMRLLF